ncbi:MAG: DNA polymerase III subunit gamma/tau [Pseudomonadota bacterium]
MSNYLPLARKYRPSKFADLVGQEALTKTLSYAILNNKISQSYLLSGIRGIGKTTSARIIAKTINCTGPIESEGLVSACEQCHNCISFSKNNHPDIVEIDAASSTGVDDVRAVLESAEYKPLIGKFKVFIIDEVHMFSKSAFNAMLKTLEEPPKSVIFILATTELNKIPITIISRCQRFDLRRLDSSEVMGLLKKIAGQEDIKYEDSALELIALKSDGSARDGLSMLDQAASLSQGEESYSGIVTLNLVQEMIGAGGLDVVVEYTKAIWAKDVDKALGVLGQIYLKTSDILSFFESVIDVIGYAAKIRSIDKYQSAIYTSHDANIRNSIANLDIAHLTVLWQIFTHGIQELKNSHNQLLTAEILSIKAIYATTLPSPSEVVELTMQSRLPRRS